MVNITNVLDAQIYQSRRIILELMEYQGFDTSQYANFSTVEVNAMIQHNQLDMLLESKNDTNKRKTYIHYYLTKSLRPANIHAMIDELFTTTGTLNNNDTLYMIIKDNINDTLINELKQIWEQSGIFIVIQNIKELQFNILKHTLVPQHIIINEDEVFDVMTKFNVIDKSHLPDIARLDPVAKAIGMRPGQVCKIIRPSKTAITTNYYRVCV